jgi:hypothetical protein
MEVSYDNEYLDKVDKIEEENRSMHKKLQKMEAQR